MLRSILLLDEDVSGFVGVAILGVKGSYGWGCFRPKADVGRRPLPAKSGRSRFNAQNPPDTVDSRLQN